MERPSIPMSQYDLSNGMNSTEHVCTFGYPCALRPYHISYTGPGTCVMTKKERPLERSNDRGCKSANGHVYQHLRSSSYWDPPVNDGFVRVHTYDTGSSGYNWNDPAAKSLSKNATARGIIRYSPHPTTRAEVPWIPLTSYIGP